ncbi:MAG: hypothetical protein J0M23_07720 [Rickettsiales bacterium]|nr:hypothetical protein [Rickettsiales bacterium]
MIKTIADQIGLIDDRINILIEANKVLSSRKDTLKLYLVVAACFRNESGSLSWVKAGLN